jgi:hypothetical protein
MRTRGLQSVSSFLPSDRDKKFEGYSFLKKPTSKKTKQLESKEAAKLQEEYILNLQKQIVLMEQELKLLKEREVEQKNSISGYETLLKDGIPLNEHFIALKNKFNRDKEDEEKRIRYLEEETQAHEKTNKDKRHRVEMLNHEYEDLSRKTGVNTRQTKTKTIQLETQLFDNDHQSEMIEREMGREKEILGNLQNENVEK